jgi:hypothetical protein
MAFAVCGAILLRLRLGGSVRWLGMDVVGGMSKATVSPRLHRVASIREMIMAKVIEFYIPASFRKPLKGAPEQPCGKVIEFCTQTRKSA